MSMSQRPRNDAGGGGGGNSSKFRKSGGGDPFALIERGNAMESSGNLWSAADAFGSASVILRSEASALAEEIAAIEAQTSASSKSGASKSVTERASARTKKLGDKRNICSLYLEQSRVYLHKARKALLAALQFETAEDERRASDAQRMADGVGPMGRKLKIAMENAEPLVGMLPPREANRRRQIFSRIYAGGEEEEELEEQQQEKNEHETKERQTQLPKAAEEKKDDANDKTSADVRVGGDTDAEIEAELLEEMDAEFGTGLSATDAAPTGNAEDTKDVGGDDDLALPAAPNAPTMPKSSHDDDALIIPSAPGDGAGHIERKDDNKKPKPPQPSSSADIPPSPPAHKPRDGGPDTTADGEETTGADGENANADADDADKLQARLAAFESTLPPGMKSQDERVADIHKGLGRLGLSLPDNKTTIADVFKSHTMSDEEQIKEIMDMAADEAALEGADADEVAAVAARAAAAGGSDGDGNDDEDLIINDADDLNAVLTKAGLTSSDIKAEVSKIEEVLGEDGKRILRDIKDGGGGRAVADRAKALSLIASAQELLFEASAYLEDDDDLDGQEEIDDDSDANDKNGIENKKKKESEALRKGRAGLVGARKCLDGALKALPS